MRCGLYLPNFGAFGDVHTLVAFAVEAERAGWHGFFLWDHLVRAWATNVVDPWIALAAVATSTRDLRFGALVTPLPRRRPWKVARETATLDRLSGGRLVFGAGLGSQGGAHPEWEAFGEETNLRTRARMLDEGLAVLAGLWSGEPFSHAGAHYQVDGACFTPTPLQSPRIPIWIAGYWPAPAPFRRAARWDGAFPLSRHGVVSPDEVRALRAFVAAERGSADGFDVVHLAPPLQTVSSATANDLVAPYRDAGATWWLERLTPDEFGGDWTSPWPVEAMLDRVRRGPPNVA